MLLIIRLSIILLCFTINAQNSFNSNGFEVTKQDLELNVYEQDSTATALIIYETGRSYVDKESFLLKTEVKKKLKILTREGFNYATENIYLYRNNKKKEVVKNIRATVYNIDNNKVSKTQLESSAIFEEDVNENYTLVKFTFPNINEGSVIVYSYTLESPYMFKYKSWYFQDNIPKLYSEYRPSIPGNWEYNIKLVGGKQLHTNTSSIKKGCLSVGNSASADCAEYVYIMKDIPAFIDEEFMTTRENYLARIEYELKVFRSFDGKVDYFTKSWETVESELKNDINIGRQLKKSSITKDLLGENITSISEPEERAKAIYKFVQEYYTWDKTYKIFKEVSIKDLIKNKSGNVSEINILLHNLLDANGIEVKPVLVSTRNNGLATNIYPVISDFNYLIIQAIIGQNVYLLDATDDYLTFGQLPFRCLNQYGRLLDFKNGGHWVDITANTMSVISYNADLKINDELILGDINGKQTGYHALKAKKQFFNNKETYVSSYTNRYPTKQFDDFKIEIISKSEPDFNERFTVKQPLETIGDNLYLNPFLITFFEENPLRLQKRTYPIDFGYKDTYLYKAELNIEGFEIVDIPKSKIQNLPNNSGKLIFKIDTLENKISIYFKFNFKEAIYSSEYYDYLKQYFSSIVDIQKNSLIVLKKRS